MARRGFSLEADIQPTVDDSAAESEAEDMRDTFESELGDLQVGANADGLGEGMGSPGGRGGGAAGATAGAAAGRGGIGSMLKGGGAAAAALPVALAGATAFGILKGVQALARHSPALSQTLGLFSEAMSLFFRPFGNALSETLRPAAEGLLTMSTNFNDVVDSEGLAVGLAWLGGSVVTELGDAFSTSMGDLASGDIEADDLFSVSAISLAASAFYTVSPVGATASAFYYIDETMDISPSNIITLGQDTFTGAIELGQWLFEGYIDLGQWMFSGAIDLGQWLFDESTSIDWADIKWAGSVGWDAIKWTGSIGWDAITWTGSVYWSAISWSGNIAWGAITWGGELLWSAINWSGSISPGNIISGSIDIADYVTGSISGGDSGGWIPGAPDPGDIPDHAPDIPGLAQGAVARRPTRATIGEAGPEAVMPLDDLGRMVSRAIRQGVRGAQQATGGGNSSMTDDATSELRTLVREMRKTRKAIEGLDTGGTDADGGEELDPF